VDISTAQLACGRTLAAEAGVTIDFRPADMDALPVADLGRFDLVHSTYALPFAIRPAACIRALHELLHPGGTLLLTTAHPVYASEWVTLDSGEEGAVITNYFEPLRDDREAEDGHQGVSSCAVPLSAVFGWLQEAGFRVNRLVEPRPLPIPSMSEDDIERRIPYHSASWRDLYDVLACIPVVAIFRATR
jgi:SAM-dependent methyltransferase